MGEKKIYFDVAIDPDDVLDICLLLTKKYKRSQASPDKALKTVFLAMIVAELEVLWLKDSMKKHGVLNDDEIIEGIRLQSGERASYMKREYEKG